jgi:hypothetical protein
VSQTDLIPIPGYTKPARDELVRIIADAMERARRAGITEDAVVADMILRSLRARRVKMVLHEFEEAR